MDKTIIDETISPTKKCFYYDNYPHQMPVYLADLTYNLDTYYNYFGGYTHDTLQDIFWHGFECLIHDPNKKKIIKNWKYGNSFLLAEKSYNTNNYLFGSNKTSQQNFILGFLMFEIK
jgi:hypothetical protein